MAHRFVVITPIAHWCIQPPAQGCAAGISPAGHRPEGDGPTLKGFRRSLRGSRDLEWPISCPDFPRPFQGWMFTVGVWAFPGWPLPGGSLGWRMQRLRRMGIQPVDVSIAEDAGLPIATEDANLPIVTGDAGLPLTTGDANLPRPPSCPVYADACRTCQQTPPGSMMCISRPHGNAVGGRSFTWETSRSGPWPPTRTNRRRDRSPQR